MKSNQQQHESDLSDQDRNEAIDRLYDVALDPERYETLLDVWESAVGPCAPKQIFRHRVCWMIR